MKFGFYGKVSVICLLSIVFLLACFSFDLSDTVVYAEEDNTLLASFRQFSYNDEAGMPTGDANYVLQASDGYLWIASYGGLVRYDGKTFATIRDEALTSSSINVLYETTDGKILVGSNDKGLFAYGRDDRVTRFADNDILSRTAVKAMARDGRGNVLVATNDGIAIVNAGGFVEIINIDLLKNPEIVPNISNSISSIDYFCGEIWGIMNSETVFALDDSKTVKFVGDSSFFGGRTPNTIKPISESVIAVGMVEGILALITVENGEYSSPSYLDVSEVGTVNYIYSDPGGRLWICGDDAVGYFEKENGSYGGFSAMTKTIIDNSIEMMTMDFEGNYWFASSRQGLLQLVRSKVFSLNVLIPALDKQVVNSTVEYKGILYIATDTGVLGYDRETYAEVSNSFTTLLSGIRTRCLTVDSRGVLWAASYKNFGLVSFDGTTCSSLTEGLPSLKVRTVIELENGDIAVGTSLGAAVVRDGSVIRTYTASDGLENTVILCIAEDFEGKLCLGTDGGGVYVFDEDGNLYNTINVGKGLDSNIILRVVSDPADDALWISTGVSLYYWRFTREDGVKVVELTEAKVDTGSIYDIKFVKMDEDYTIWLLKATGLLTFSRRAILSGEGIVKTEYKKKDGLHSYITANSFSYLGENGLLYLCGSSGVDAIDTENIPKSDIRPILVLKSINVDGEEYGISERIVLPSTSSRIEIKYAMISFYHSSGIVEYILEGVDGQLHRVSSDDDAPIVYMNLEGGSYVMRIQAYNGDGLMAESEIVLVLDKQLKFIEKEWAKWLIGILSAIASAGIVLLIIYLNTRRINKRHAEYKQITDQAMTAISKTIDAKDKYTIGHSKRVADYSVKMAKALGMPDNKVEEMRYIGLLHDIGKIGVPDDILNKPGKLTAEEFERIKQHPAIGGEILKDFTALENVTDGALYHHERYDGKGYNMGLSGEKIPFVARIIAVADTFDAMNTDRPYRVAFSREVIVSELIRVKGSQLDPNIVDVFIKLLEQDEI